MKTFCSRICFSLLVLCAALAAALVLGGCSSGESAGGKPDQPAPAAEEDDDRINIGLSFDSYVIERWIRDRDVFVATAQELGAKVNVQNANGDLDEQIAQIRYLIGRKMDVIVIVAIDASRLSQVIEEARDKGIKIVCYDRLILNSGADLYISFDNEKVGMLMGQAMKKAMPEGGDVFEILGSASDNNTSQVKEGFEEELEGSDLRIVYSSYCDNWLAELAFDGVNEGLKENGGSVDGVMCGNDDLAGQAIRALTEKRLAGKVPVVGQDAELSACQRIVEGTQTMSVFKSVEEEARIAAKLACALAEGKDITDPDFEIPVTDVISDGKNDIPYYRIDPVAVDKSNMDSMIIDSGFHMRDEVYMNVNESENDVSVNPD